MDLIKMHSKLDMSRALFQLKDKEICLVFKVLLSLQGGVAVVCELLSMFIPIRAVTFLFPSSNNRTCLLEAEVTK